MSVVLALGATIRAYLQLRRAEYYVVREDARRVALRSALLVFLFLIITLGVMLLPRRAPAQEQLPTFTLRPTAASTPTRPAPTRTLAPAWTPQPTATEPFIPTSTPRATLPLAFTSPLPAAVPPPGDARFQFWALAEGVEDNQPVQPASEFPAGIRRVYVFFRYDGLLPNVPWTLLWYQDGELVTGDTRLWEPEQSAGARHHYLEFAGGFPAGEYEVQVWLGDRLQIRVPFSVVDSAVQPSG